MAKILRKFPKWENLERERKIKADKKNKEERPANWRDFLDETELFSDERDANKPDSLD